MCHKTTFSEHGLGIYLASPSELEKYTVCSEVAEQTTEAMGELFVACEMPETPKNTSFLKGVSSIFGSSPRPSDGADIDLICGFFYSVSARIGDRLFVTESRDTTEEA